MHRRFKDAAAAFEVHVHVHADAHSARQAAENTAAPSCVRRAFCPLNSPLAPCLPPMVGVVTIPMAVAVCGGSLPAHL